MPIYAYRCASCGFEKDHLQKLNAPSLDTCPQCGEQTYRKQVTAAGFQLKGQGWYATDFKNKDMPKAPKPQNAPSAPADKDSTPSAPSTQSTQPTQTAQTTPSPKKEDSAACKCNSGANACAAG